MLSKPGQTRQAHFTYELAPVTDRGEIVLCLKSDESVHLGLEILRQIGRKEDQESETQNPVVRGDRVSSTESDRRN